MNNFNKFYEKAKIEEEIQAKKKRSSWEEAKRGDKQSLTVLYNVSYNFEGVFQNIHESFDEIDSKSLNQLYSTKRTPASEISGGVKVKYKIVTTDKGLSMSKDKATSHD